MELRHFCDTHVTRHYVDKTWTIQKPDPDGLLLCLRHAGILVMELYSGFWYRRLYVVGLEVIFVCGVLVTVLLAARSCTHISTKEIGRRRRT